MIEERLQTPLDHVVGGIACALGGGPPGRSISERYPSLTIDDAYAVSVAATRQTMQARAAHSAGWKVGLTSVASQRTFGVHEPMFGPLLDFTQIDNGGTLATPTVGVPRVEAEIAFKMAGPIGPDPTIEDVLKATLAIAPAIEIRDVRDAIVDSGRASAFVVGDWRSSEDVDLPKIVATVTGDDTQLGSGRASRVLGHPAHSVAWLSTQVANLGYPLREGTIVLTGAVVGPFDTAGLARVKATFDSSLGEVSFSLR
jgi:2-keto-4-pentenoate hydratase